MEVIGQNIAGIESNPKHQNLDIQKLEQEAVPAGQGAGGVRRAAASLSDEGLVSQIQHIGRADVFRHRDDLRDQLSQGGAAETADQHDGDEPRPDAQQSDGQMRLRISAPISRQPTSLQP